jgi:hypothetical protein
MTSNDGVKQDRWGLYRMTGGRQVGKQIDSAGRPVLRLVRTPVPGIQYPYTIHLFHTWKVLGPKRVIAETCGKNRCKACGGLELQEMREKLAKERENAA